AVDRARSVLTQLAQEGIDIEAVTGRLEAEGVAAFARSWETLLDTVGRRREAIRLAARTTARLGPAARGVVRAVAGLAAERVGDRLWAEDAVLWKRQGIPGTGSFAWLDVPEPNAPAVVAITTFAQEVRAAGLTQVVVCGI